MSSPWSPPRQTGAGLGGGTEDAAQMQRRLMPSLEQAGRGASEKPRGPVTAHRTVCPLPRTPKAALAQGPNSGWRFCC